MPTLEGVKAAFADIADKIEFVPGQDGVLVQKKPRAWLEDDEFAYFNGEVVPSLGGHYDSVRRGWIIPFEAQAAIPPTKTPTQVEFVPEFKTAAGKPVELKPKAEPKPFEMVPVEALVSSPFQPRLSQDEEFLGELVESIRKKGVLSPLLVRPLPSGNLEIVDGNTTLQAAKAAGLVEVPCIARAMSDQEAFEAAWDRNNTRRDWSDYEKARFLNEYGRRYGLNQDQIAEKIGTTKGRISQLFAMVKAEQENQFTAVNLQKLSERQFRAIMVLPPEKRSEVFAEIEKTGQVPSLGAIESSMPKPVEAPPKAEPPKMPEIPTPTTGIIEPPKTPEPVKHKGPYFCSFCNRDRYEFEVRFGNCRTCGRPVEVVAKAPKALPEEVGTEPQPEPVAEKKGVEFPVTPFPERLKVSVSQAEIDLYMELQKDFAEDKLKARPFLNDDHSYFIIVRLAYPDIVFKDVPQHVLIHLDGEEVHKGHEAWDNEVSKAIGRENKISMRFPIRGSGLSQAERRRLADEIDKIVNAEIENKNSRG